MKGMPSLTVVWFLLCPALGLAQAQPAPYLSYYVAKVKKDKLTDFEALVKKVVEANRQHTGDNWIASQVVFGDHDTYYFGSLRTNQASIDKAQEAFMGALTKAFGQAGADKLMQDLNNCLISSKSELRQLRPNLSRNAPSDPAELMKLIGKSRLARTSVTRIRPGRGRSHTESIRAVNEALHNAGSKSVTIVSQASAGVQGTVYYTTTLQSSFGGFDPTGQEPAAGQVLGDDVIEKFIKAQQENVLVTEVMITGFRPDLSNPPEEVASADPAYWRPKK